MAKTSTAPLLLGAGAVALMATKGKKKKKGKRGHWGIRVSKDCQLVEITNMSLFRDFLLGGYDELIGIDPDLDIFQVADAMFGEVAPNCAPFPEHPESAGVAELYRVIVKSVTGFMVANRDPQIAEMINNPRAKEFVEWYAYWRNPPSSDLPSVPDNEVAFATDFSRYEIGSDWYAGTVRPFVAALAQAGNAGDAYQSFIENRAVAVGRVIIPIAELPEDTATVQQFIAEVQNAVNQALAEMS